MPFWCYSYPTTHNRELLDKLKDAGCVAITMGVQSGSERVLKEHFNRPTKSDRVIAAAEEIVEAGITGFYDLITRVDFETVEDLDEYSEDVIAAESKGILNRPSDQDYDFYHHLYLLSRSTLPVSKIREIRNDPKYRENPSLMTEFFDHQPVMNFTDPVPKRERQSA